MDQSPTIPQLMKFGARHVNIIREIGDNYHRFGIMLLEDATGNRMNTIEMENYGDFEAINLAILRRWMIGEGRKPTNWATLATVLKTSHCSQLAAEMRYMWAKSGTSQSLMSSTFIFVILRGWIKSTATHYISALRQVLYQLPGGTISTSYVSFLF